MNEYQIQQLKGAGHRARKFTIEIFAEEEGAEERFGIEVLEALMNGATFKDLEKIKRPIGITDEHVNNALESSIHQFLDTADELLAFPNVSDWANYINAPQNYIEEIIKSRGPSSVIEYLPRPDEGALTRIYEDDIEALRKSLKSKKELFDGAVTIKRLNNIFGTLANDDESSFKNYYEDYSLVDEVKRYFKKDLTLIKRYKNDLEQALINQVNTGQMEELLKEVKQQNMSKGDSVLFVFRSYLLTDES
jgi:hypothetical protein